MFHSKCTVLGTGRPDKIPAELIIHHNYLEAQFLRLHSCWRFQVGLFPDFHNGKQVESRAVARALIGGGGWCIFIYSSYARLISFEISCY